MIKLKDLKFYEVFLDKKNSKYITVNKMTKVIEDEGVRLPTVLFQAEALDELLIKFYDKDIPSETAPR